MTQDRVLLDKTPTEKVEMDRGSRQLERPTDRMRCRIDHLEKSL